MARPPRYEAVRTSGIADLSSRVQTSGSLKEQADAWGLPRMSRVEDPARQIKLLADLLERSLKVLIAEPPPVPARRKKRTLPDLFASPQQRRLAELLGEQWDRIAGIRDDDAPGIRSFRSPNRMEAARLAMGLLETRGRWFFCRFPDHAYDPLARPPSSFEDRIPDCSAIARRVATHLAAVEPPHAEAVVVDVSGSLPRLDLGQGWILASYDDPIMPIEINESDRDLEHLHRHRKLAVLVRDNQPGSGLHSQADSRSLSWPLAVLNLALERPVRALTAYRMIPGGALLHYENDLVFGTCFVPAEIARWDPRPDHITARTWPPLGAGQRSAVARLARKLDRNINDGQLQRWQLAQFWHVIDRLLTVSYHTSDRQLPEGEHEPLPFMDPTEATVQLVAGLEGLFDDEGVHSEITRRLAQRAAVLTARTALDRTAIRDRISRHYGIRSDRAHGSSTSVKPADVPDLRDLVRRAVIGWAALAPSYGTKRAMAKALDDALMSPTIDRHITTLISDFAYG
jgi:hypothetical protein